MRSSLVPAPVRARRPVMPARLLGLLLGLTSACAPASTPSTAPAPVQGATRPALPSVAGPPALALPESPVNWQLRDLATDGIAGTGSDRALRELLAGRTPGRTVVVAVIDGGIDTAHVDLRPVLWENPGERGGTGRDDDGNGYIDDLRGWNFIGGKSGENVHHDTFELTRLHAACGAERRAGAAQSAPRVAECEELAEAYDEKRTEVLQTLAQIENIGRALDGAVSVLRPAVAGELTRARVEALSGGSTQVMQARQMFLQLDANGITPSMLEEAREAYGSQAKFGLDTLFDPRGIVGDDYANGAQRDYGNSDIAGPDAKHGSHVAGIIAAVRGNNEGLDGITDGVRIMGVRAVPDGDERDKDVANAIRYAVDNGAHIINMSFGKGYSPEKPLVDAAVRYAEEKGVLLVHAAGNDGEDIDVTPNFPSAQLDGGAKARLWIEVGASSWKGGTELAAPFSNYGKTRVDLFAPGVDIYSAVPGSTYERQSGTSMAAPVVSGVAALLMAYYPELTAADVKEILLASVTRLGDVSVQPPGSPPSARVAFGELSVTGGIVNAYEAVKMAEARRAARQP
jgi:subtilisin family serine protease